MAIGRLRIDDCLMTRGDHYNKRNGHRVGRIDCASPDTETLELLMSRMAEGESEAFADFRVAFDDRLVAAARWHAARFGWFPDEVSVASLATQFALEIFDKAASWKPGLATPWTWMSRRFREIVRCERKVESCDLAFDETLAQTATIQGVPDDRDVLDVLRKLAGRETRAQSLLAWSDEAGVNDRDLRVWIEFRQQKHQGDPSPSLTVSAMAGLSPANVRQIAHRVTKRALLAELSIAA